MIRFSLFSVGLMALTSARECALDSDNGKSGADELIADGGPGGPESGSRTDGGGSQPDATSPSCASVSSQAVRIPLYALVVLDGGGSMDGASGDGGFVVGSREVDPLNPRRPTSNDNGSTGGQPGLTGKKWLTARSMLLAYWDQLAAEKPGDTGLGMGLYLFSSTKAKPSTAFDIPIRVMDTTQSARLGGRIRPTEVGATSVYAAGASPLLVSITDQADLLKRMTPSPPLASGGKRVLVVVTDGTPSGGSSGDPAEEKDNVIQAVSSLRSGNPSVITLVVGVGDPLSPVADYDEGFLGHLAQVGGAATPGCNANWSNGDTKSTPCHLQMTPGTKPTTQLRDELAVALRAIGHGIASCQLGLPKGPGVPPPNASNTRAVLTSENGAATPVPQDAIDGWAFDNAQNPTAIRVNGQACAGLRAPGGKIEITTCGTR